MLNMGHEEKSCYIGSSLVFTISQGPYFNLKVSYMFLHFHFITVAIKLEKCKSGKISDKSAHKIFIYGPI